MVQGFNTGGHRTGYTLREIEFEVEGHPDSFTVYPHITLAEASPLFVSEVATLTYNRKRSVDYAHSVNTMVTYTVPEDVTLDPLVAYYLKFASPGQAGYSIAFSRKKSYRVERPNQYGWSMVSTLYWQRSGWNYYNHTTIGGIPCGIRITAVGYRNVDGPNRLPTSANGRIAAGQGRDYVFGRSDFTFSDPDTLDPFSGLEITSLPDSGAGTLKLDGTALGAQDLPKTVTRSELDSGKFVYTPPSGEPGRKHRVVRLQGERRHGDERLELHDEHLPGASQSGAGEHRANVDADTVEAGHGVRVERPGHLRKR